MSSSSETGLKKGKRNPDPTLDKFFRRPSQASPTLEPYQQVYFGTKPCRRNTSTTLSLSLSLFLYIYIYMYIHTLREREREREREIEGEG